ncbi:MAG TPA: thiamine pyrophosphate-dependent enzyme [Burkholderiales bacterium]|nr:thiamine pyrophosphate-dependent enzyme [Burkholderiales bacterium]
MSAAPGLSALEAIAARAAFIARAGGVAAALASGQWPAQMNVTLAEGLVLGLLKQGVRKVLAIFGHGSTALAEVLRVYDAAGVTRTCNFRNEVAMAHAATALRWQYNELAAVVTSIGPGALQAMAGSLAAASNGVGVYHIYGDETTHGEGYNMQQVPKPEQGIYGRMTALMGRSYVLHTPQALREALREGAVTVNHPYKAGPFYLLLPINMQPAVLQLNLAALPDAPRLAPVRVAADEPFDAAVEAIRRRHRIVIKAGGGARRFAAGLRALAERIGAVVVLSPGSTGVLPDDHPQNLHVGGSKGTSSGNFAMENAELLIAIGTRAVCQADCSGIGYPQVREVINLNGDADDVFHYNHTLALQGDIGATLERLLAALCDFEPDAGRREWLAQCLERKRAWAAFKRERCSAAPLYDEVWRREVLTQPAAIHTVAAFAKARGALKLFDAGDVQANGFQIVEDDAPFDTITESGASYMGFAVSAMLASALADSPRYPIAFCGDGSFTMNPQVLIDAVEHRLRGMIVVFDNRSMAAIGALQKAQYGAAFRTSDGVVVDYVAMANAVTGVYALPGGTSVGELTVALERAYRHLGLSFVHVPVYGGDDPCGGMGAYGSWNVGNWCEDVQQRYHSQGL